jgi:hypothetical protein
MGAIIRNGRNTLRNLSEAASVPGPGKVQMAPFTDCGK